jgi:hypothetical protein
MIARNLLLSFASLSFIIVIGGAVYEHMAVVPRWSAAPPSSLAMFQGPYGLNPAPFWQIIHPITLLFFIAALISNWKTLRRKLILVVFGGYFLILIITAIYFVPELISVTGTAFSETVDADLTRRAGQWETLSLVRLIFLLGLAITLLTSLTKPASRPE